MYYWNLVNDDSGLLYLTKGDNREMKRWFSVNQNMPKRWHPSRLIPGSRMQVDFKKANADLSCAFTYSKPSVALHHQRRLRWPRPTDEFWSDRRGGGSSVPPFNLWECLVISRNHSARRAPIPMYGELRLTRMYGSRVGVICWGGGVN